MRTEPDSPCGELRLLKEDTLRGEDRDWWFNNLHGDSCWFRHADCYKDAGALSPGGSFLAEIPDWAMWMIVFVYLPWCPSSQNFGPEFDRLAAALSSVQTPIYAVAIDGSRYHTLVRMLGLAEAGLPVVMVGYKESFREGAFKHMKFIVTPDTAEQVRDWLKEQTGVMDVAKDMPERQEFMKKQWRKPWFPSKTFLPMLEPPETFQDIRVAVGQLLHNVFTFHTFPGGRNGEEFQAFIRLLDLLCAFFPSPLDETWSESASGNVGRDCRLSICELRRLLTTYIDEFMIQQVVFQPKSQGHHSSWTAASEWVLDWARIERAWRYCLRPWGTITQKQWSACAWQPDHHIRGLPCGLWLLMHRIAPVLDKPKPSPGHGVEEFPETVRRVYDAAKTLREGILRFFNCAGCRRNFEKIAFPQRHELVTAQDAALWYWSAHNKITALWDLTPRNPVDHTKEQLARLWPSEAICETCGTWPQVATSDLILTSGHAQYHDAVQLVSLPYQAVLYVEAEQAAMIYLGTTQDGFEAVLGESGHESWTARTDGDWITVRRGKGNSNLDWVEMGEIVPRKAKHPVRTAPAGNRTGNYFWIEVDTDLVQDRHPIQRLRVGNGTLVGQNTLLEHNETDLVDFSSGEVQLQVTTWLDIVGKFRVTTSNWQCYRYTGAQDDRWCKTVGQSGGWYYIHAEQDSNAARSTRATCECPCCARPILGMNHTAVWNMAEVKHTLATVYNPHGVDLLEKDDVGHRFFIPTLLNVPLPFVAAAMLGLLAACRGARAMRNKLRDPRNVQGSYKVEFHHGDLEPLSWQAALEGSPRDEEDDCAVPYEHSALLPLPSRKHKSWKYSHPPGSHRDWTTPTPRGRPE
uniref:Sulfhydryl oxidase n=1 Tax=Oxyrrhis marina TaxID=2969 RepID=A0A7S4GPV5_OXYMA